MGYKRTQDGNVVWLSGGSRPEARPAYQILDDLNELAESAYFRGDPKESVLAEAVEFIKTQRRVIETINERLSAICREIDGDGNYIDDLWGDDGGVA